MTEHNYDRALVSNIEISDEMKSSLINDVKSGRRTREKSFRYSTMIMALCIAGTSFICGAGASAAFITYRNRVENMAAEEQAQYSRELENDTYNTGEEAMTRPFTKSEIERLIKLEKDYYNNGVFPKENMPDLKTLDELEDGMLAFVEEDNKLHLPEEELSDEQILEFIDHEAKYLYTIEKNAETIETVEAPDDDNYDKITFDVSSDDEAALKEESKKLIAQFYGEEVDDSWKCEVHGANYSELEAFGDEWDGYGITWCENDAPNARFFELQIPKNENGIFIMTRGGAEVFKDCEKFTWDDAQEYKDQGEETVKKFVKEKFGLGEPDRIEYGGFEDAGGDPTDSDTIFYELYYGEEHVTVDWLISLDKVNGIVGTGILK